jgi:Carbohydrate-selective porin, OprB family
MRRNNWQASVPIVIIAAGLLSAGAEHHALAQSSDAQSSDAQSSTTEIAPFGPSTKVMPAPGVRPLGQGGARDFMSGLTTELDKMYDQYLAFKKDINDRYNLDFSMDVSIYPQFGTPNGGKPVDLLVYYPSVTWKPFTNTSIGSGEFNFTFGHQQYWTLANTGSQAAHMGLITWPNDWVSNNYSWSTVAYTHTLPGVMKFLSVTVGQYNLFSFDPNAYAGNAQVNFISYPFAQDATQTFPNAGLGAYATVKTPDEQFALSGGFQGATNLNGREITTEGYQAGKYTYWGNFQWTPTIPSLGKGIYSILYYEQPAVPAAPTHSNGISFSASQEIGNKWGAFIRGSNASGAGTLITTSVAIGGVRNDPFDRNPLDQAGLAFAWDKTDYVANGVTPATARGSELVTELYYAFTVFKGMQITPDVQLFFHPALAPNTATAAVFTIRSTFFF